LVGKPIGKRLLQTRHNLKDNIEMDFRELGYDVDWIHVADGRDW
jgi:hypothetical protein